MGSQDRWKDGEPKHKNWYIEGLGICLIANKPCPVKGVGKDFNYKKCKDCVNFSFKIEEEITDWDATM